MAHLQGAPQCLLINFPRAISKNGHKNVTK